MKTEFDTGLYFFSHQKQPRGRGSWAFEFEDSREPWFAPSSLTITEAKKAAVAEAKRRAGPTGVATTVKVLP